MRCPWQLILKRTRNPQRHLQVINMSRGSINNVFAPPSADCTFIFVVGCHAWRHNVNLSTRHSVALEIEHIQTTDGRQVSREENRNQSHQSKTHVCVSRLHFVNKRLGSSTLQHNKPRVVQGALFTDWIAWTVTLKLTTQKINIEIMETNGVFTFLCYSLLNPTMKHQTTDRRLTNAF